MHYVSWLAMTEEAMLFLVRGTQVPTNGVEGMWEDLECRCLQSFCKHVPLQQSGSSHCLPLQPVVSRALYQIQMF